MLLPCFWIFILIISSWNSLVFAQNVPTKWVVGKSCSPSLKECCCDAFITRTLKQSITSTKTLNLVTVTKTVTVNGKSTSVKHSSSKGVSTIKQLTTTTKSSLKATPKSSLKLSTKATTTKIPLLEARAVKCQPCPKNTLLTKSFASVKTSTCCLPASTKTVSQISTKVVTISLKTRRTTTKVITITKGSSHQTSPSRMPGILTTNTPYIPISSIEKTTRTHSGYTYTATKDKRVKPSLNAHPPNPKVASCKTSPTAGYIQLTYPNGIKVTPAIYIPKPNVHFVCDVKNRLNQPIIISINQNLYGNKIDWTLYGNVSLTTGRSLLGLGLVTFKSLDESNGNVTNIITIPATSLTKSIPGMSKNLLRPTIQDILGEIKMEYEFSSTGTSLGLEKIPNFIWQTLKVPLPYTQQSLTNWLTTTLKLTDKPSFVNGLSYFAMEFKPSKKAPFQAFLSLHNVVKTLPTSFISSSIYSELYGKPGSWNLPRPTQRSMSLRPFQDTVLIQVPARNIAELCRLKLPSKAMGFIKHVPRLQHSNTKIPAMLTLVICKKDDITSWQASWSLVGTFIDFTPPELVNVTQDVNPIQSGQITFDSSTGLLYKTGTVTGLAVRFAPDSMNSLNFKQLTGYYDIEWTFSSILDMSKSEPLKSLKLWASSNMTQFSGEKVHWISLSSPESRKCLQGNRMVPCLVPIRNGTKPILWPLHSTGRYISKVSPKQGYDALAKVLVGNLTVEWTPKALLIKGYTQLAKLGYPTSMNLTIPLAKNKIGLGRLGVNVTVTEHVVPVGTISAVLTRWPCNNLHQGVFNMTKLSSSVMTLRQGVKYSSVTVLDSKLLTGPTNITFSCTPQGDVQGINVIGSISDFSTKLFDDAQMVKLVRPRFQFHQGYSTLQASHSRTNRNITFYIANQKNNLPFLGNPKPIWAVEGVKQSDVNYTLIDFLGASSALKFRQFFDNCTSRLIHQTWSKPGATNITIGYLRSGNDTLHDVIFFANTRLDPLVGKPVWKQQQLSKLHNVKPWSLKPSGKQWKGYPKMSGLPLTYRTQRGYNLTQGSHIGFPLHQMKNSTKPHLTNLQKRQATSTTTFPTISSTAIPTFTNVASSNISSNNNVLQVASNAFAYEWIFGTNNMTASFAGTEVCPPQLQQVIMSGSVPSFGNLSGFSGTGTFICSQGVPSEPISFATQSFNSNSTILPVNTFLNLFNATMQVNCVPDSNTCFWPSVLIGSPIYGFSSAMNGTSYWESLNVTQLMVNAQASNPSLTPAQQDSVVSSLLQDNSAWAQAVSQLNGILEIPSFLIQDPFALSLLAEDLYNVPVASFQCNNQVQYTCDTPTVIMSGQLVTVNPQPGSVLMHGSIFSTSTSGTVLDRQTLASQLNGFGSFAGNLTQDVCSGPINGISYLLTGVTSNVLSGTNGVVQFNCQQGQIFTWNFSIPVGTVSSTVILSGTSSSYTMENAQVVYFADLDFLGTQSTYNGLTHMIATQPNSCNTSTFLQSSSTSPNSLTSLGSASSPFQSFWSNILSNVPTTYASFNLNTTLADFSVTYNGTLANGTLAFDVGFNDQVGNIKIDANIGVSLAQSNFGSLWQVQSDNGSITIGFGGNDYVELQLDQVPCTDNANGALNLTGIVNVTLPGIGDLVGTVGVDFICATSPSSHIWSDVQFYGTIQGPFSVEILGGVLVVEQVGVSYDTASGLLSVNLDMMNANISISYDFNGTSSYLNNVYIDVPGPISPFNTSLPFSNLWLDALGSVEVSQLTNEVLIDPLTINYTYAAATNSTGDSFILQGNLIVGDVDANLYLSLQQIQPGNTTSWYLEAADLQLTINNQIIVSIAGSSPCQVGVETVNVTLQNFGPFVQPATFLGTLLLSCNSNNSISSFYVNASASNIPVTIMNDTEYLSASISYDSSTKLLTVQGGTQDWNLNFMIDFANSTDVWSIAVGTTQPLSWSQVPFSNGLTVAFGQSGSSQLQNVSGVSLQSFNFLYNSSPEAFNFSASVGESMNGINVGEGVIIDMLKVNGSWSLLDVAFIFDTVFPIGDIGVVSLNGTIGCPTGTLTGLASLGGVPQMQMTIQANANVYWVCRSYYNLSIALANLTIGIGKETLELSQVSISYSNLTNLLDIQGTVLVQNANAGGFASINVVIQVANSQTNTKTGLVSVFVDLGDGSETSLYNSGLPISGLLNSAVSGTASQPVTPNAAMINLNYTYYAATPSSLASMSFLGYIQDGSYSGSFLMNLDQVQVLVPGIVNGTTEAVSNNKTSWVANLVQVNVTLSNYGTVSISGTDPCPNGQLQATANLTLPSVGNQQMLGLATFVCNSTNSIMYWTLEAQDVWTVTVDGDTEVFNGTVLYSSQFDSLGFNADWNDVVSIFFNYNATSQHNSSTWNFGMQIAEPILFNNLPFVTAMTNAMNQANTSLTNPPSNGFQISSGLIEFMRNGYDTFLFQISIAGQSNSFSGSAYTDLQVANPNGTWHLQFLDISFSLDIDNIAVLSLSIEPLCPQAQGAASILFTNLPLSIPTFGLNGTVQFGCTSSGSVNTSDYAFSATLDEPTTLNFLGEQININGMSISYNSTQDYVIFNWQPLTGFNMTLEFGNGLKNAQKMETGPPFVLYAIYEPSTNPPDALTALGQMLPSFGSSVESGSFVNPTASSGETSVSGDVNGVELNYLLIDFDAVGYSLSLSCNVQIYSVDATFLGVLAKTSGGTWQGLLGIQTTYGGQNSGLSSPYGWMNGMVGNGSPLVFGELNFFLCTGAGTYTIGNQQFKAMGAGLIMSGLLDISSGPIQNITGGNNSSPSTAGGGSFGVALGATASGLYLQVDLEITSKMFALIVDLSADITAYQNQGTSPTSYTDIQFLVMCDLTSFELTFEFDTVYFTNYGGTTLEFIGGFGLVIGDLGGSVVAMFSFSGTWSNPMSLSTYFTAASVALQIALDLDEGIPTAVDLACGMTLVDPVTVSTTNIQAALYLDVQSPLQNSAVGFSISQFSLATIVNAFWTSVPNWFEKALESFSIGFMQVSFNPSATPTTFPNPLVTAMVIPSGLIVNSTDINLFDFIYIDYAYFTATSTGLTAGVELQPINYAPLFALTSATNTSQGPSGSFVLNANEFSFTLDGSIELLASTDSVNAYIFVEPSRGETKTFINATWSYYQDQVTTLLAEETADPTFGFGLVWDMFSYNSQGFFAAIFEGWSNALQGIMQNVQSSVINSVNQQCSTAIANANRQLAYAERQLQQAQATATADINNAQAKVNEAQQNVNNMQSTCQNFHNHCGWEFWNCIAFAFCEVGYGVATGALWVASEVLEGVLEIETAIIDAAEAVVSATETVVDGVITAAEKLVDGVMTAISWVVDHLLSALATAVGWLFNLQSIIVGGMLNIANQEAFIAEMTVGFFGTTPKTYGFYFDYNNIDSVVSAAIWFGQPNMNNWFNGQLSGTPAAAYQAQISQAMVQSSVATVQMMGMSPASIIQPPIGPTKSSSIYQGETFSNAPGTIQLNSPLNYTNLIMGPNCNLYLYANNAMGWQTNTFSNNTPCALQILPNGNVILRDNTNVTLWQTFTAGTNASLLYVADDYNLYLTDLFGDIFWSSASSIQAIVPGVTVTDGTYTLNGVAENFVQGFQNTQCGISWNTSAGLQVNRWVYNSVSNTGYWLPLYTSGVGNGPPYALVNNGSYWSVVDGFGDVVVGGGNPDCNGDCIFGFIPSYGNQGAPCYLGMMNPGSDQVFTQWGNPPTCQATLAVGQNLYQTQSICNYGYYLLMEADNNLVFYNSDNVALWSSGTGPQAGTFYASLNEIAFAVFNPATNCDVWSSEALSVFGVWVLQIASTGYIQLYVNSIFGGVVWQEP